MDVKLEDGLKALLESGKRKGYLTYAQVKAFVPDDGADSGRLDRVLQLVEEMGIDLIEESEAEDRDGDAATELETEIRGELVIRFHCSTRRCRRALWTFDRRLRRRIER